MFVASFSSSVVKASRSISNAHQSDCMSPPNLQSFCMVPPLAKYLTKNQYNDEYKIIDSMCNTIEHHIVKLSSNFLVYA